MPVLKHSQKNYTFLIMSYFKAFTIAGKSAAGKAHEKLEWNADLVNNFFDIAEVSVNKKQIQ